MKKLVTETKPTMHDIAAVLTFKYGSETRKSEKKKKTRANSGNRKNEGYERFMNNQAHCKTISSAKYRYRKRTKLFEYWKRD
jgi:hypothetical protein